MRPPRRHHDNETGGKRMATNLEFIEWYTFNPMLHVFGRGRPGPFNCALETLAPGAEPWDDV